jgi:hypothetical protein
MSWCGEKAAEQPDNVRRKIGRPKNGQLVVTIGAKCLTVDPRVPRFQVVPFYDEAATTPRQGPCALQCKVVWVCL